MFLQSGSLENHIAQSLRIRRRWAHLPENEYPAAEMLQALGDDLIASPCCRLPRAWSPYLPVFSET